MKLPSLDRCVWVLFAGMALNQFGMSIVMPFIAIYLFVYQGESPALVGFAMFFSAFAGAIFQFVGGEACDRLGRRTVLIVGLIILSIFSESPWATWLVVAAAGLGCAAGFVYLRKIVPPEKNIAALPEY